MGRVVLAQCRGEISWVPGHALGGQEKPPAVRRRFVFLENLKEGITNGNDAIAACLGLSCFACNVLGSDTDQPLVQFHVRRSEPHCLVTSQAYEDVRCQHSPDCQRQFENLEWRTNLVLLQTRDDRGGLPMAIHPLDRIAAAPVRTRIVLVFDSEVE